MNPVRPDLAIFVAPLFHGGVRKMHVHLMNEFSRRCVVKHRGFISL
jgi:hypothetical protein